MPASKAQQKAVNKYMKENYERVNLTMPKGRKDVIKAIAESKGESVNGFINSAIDASINGGESGAAPLIGSDALSKVTEHIEKTQETHTQFIERAINDTIERDKSLIKMGLSPIKR